MGTCFGLCLSDSSSASEQEQERNLVDDNFNNINYNNIYDNNNIIVNNNNNNNNNNSNYNNNNTPTNAHSKNFIYRIMKTKEKRHSKFLEHFWRKHHNKMKYSRLNKSNSDNIINIKDLQLTTAPTATEIVLSQSPSSPRQVALPSTSPSFNDIQLQCLNAHSLLLLHDRNSVVTSSTKFNTTVVPHYKNNNGATTTSPSPLSSSLDLEWEHEYNNTITNHNDNDCCWVTFPEEITFDEYSSDDESVSNNSEFSKNQNHHRRRIRAIKTCMTTKNKSTTAAITTTNNNNNNNNGTSSSKHNNNCWSHISTPESLEWDVNDDEKQFKSDEDSLDNETIELLQEIEWLKNRALNETGETFRKNSKNNDNDMES